MLFLMCVYIYIYSVLSFSWEQCRVTTYLSTDNLFERRHPELVQRLVAAALEADKAQHWAILHPSFGTAGATAAACGSDCMASSNGSSSGSSDSEDYLNVRVMELHDVEPGGALSDPQHFDGGSLVTLDVMLSSPRGGADLGDFDGGSFATPESDGSVTRHDFGRGDLLVFPSHKYHYVEPVTGGHRRVMVLELWRGESRGCAHRCLQHLGPCHYSATQSKVETLLHASFPDVDPW